MPDPSERARAMVGALVQAGLLKAEHARDLYTSYTAQPPGQSFDQYLVARGAISPDVAQKLGAQVDGNAYAAAAAHRGADPSTFVTGAMTLVEESDDDHEPPPAAQAPAAVAQAPRAPPKGGIEQSLGSGRFAAAVPGSDRWGSAVQKNPLPTAQYPAQGELPSSQADTKTGSTEEPDGLRPGSSSNEDSRYASDSAGDSRVGSSRVDAATGETLVVGPGATLGSYTLVELVGKGAMGQVYKARHDSSGEVVALKVLKNIGAARTSKVRKRFRREVEALRRLHHENIVRVHTYERTGPLDWYVMDFVEGRELKEVIAKDELNQLQLLHVFEKVCAAVDHAHDRGVVHRDLKPSNVLINEFKHVWVLDFGLAKLLDNRSTGNQQLTGANAALGTPYYMSPEQIQSPQSVNLKSDIFTLGVLLYELMTGVRPFEADTSSALAKQIIRKDPAPPSSVNPDLGPEFDKLCMRALAKDPRMRYRRAEDLRAAVHEYRRTRLSLGARIGDWLQEHGRGFKTGLLIASIVYVPIIVAILAWFLI